jgi:two-component system, chemotaxis family, protein-glutamate methylesterase/glutaminase
MPRRLIVIGTSAGGIEALRELVALLPSDFSSPIAVVMHSSPHAPGIVHDILSRAGRLPAVSARNGEHLRAGYIYVAPPDFHLLVEPGRLRLAKGPKENRFRPAIDPLFRSAAQVYGPAAIGVILTGHLDDGTAGLWAIKKLGGVAIVQDPNDAMYRSMPESALHSVAVDHCVPLRDIAPLLVRLTSVPVEEPIDVQVPEHVEVEVKIANEDDPLKAGVERLGAPSAIACPECHGVLRQWTEGGRLRFRCHTGHAYSPDSLVTEIDEATEIAMWNAIRSLQEGSILMRQLAAHAESAHGAGSAAKLTHRADELERRADALRDLVQTPEPDTTGPTT